jgi:hypothetical protein
MKFFCPVPSGTGEVWGSVPLRAANVGFFQSFFQPADKDSVNVPDALGLAYQNE